MNILSNLKSLSAELFTSAIFSGLPAPFILSGSDVEMAKIFYSQCRVWSAEAILGPA